MGRKWFEVGVVAATALFGPGAFAQSSIFPTGTDQAYTYPLADKVLDAQDIDAFVKQARDAKPADQFTPAFDQSPMVGRRFSVDLDIIAVNDLAKDKQVPGWEYSIDRQALSVNPKGYGADLNAFLADMMRAVDSNKMFDDVYGFEVAHTVFRGSTEQRSNAYGATVSVTPLYMNSTGVADFGRRHNPESDNFSISIPPDKARALSAHLKLHLEGVVDRLSQNKVIGCSFSSHDATIDDATEYSDRKCFLAVKFTRADVINTEDGSIVESLTYLTEPPKKGWW